jgi:tripeptidyl-peptidase I
MIAPKDESRDLVLNWVEEAGLGRYASSYPSSDSVVLEASISQIEKLINAEYSSFGECPFC